MAFPRIHDTTDRGIFGGRFLYPNGLFTVVADPPLCVAMALQDSIDVQLNEDIALDAIVVAGDMLLVEAGSESVISATIDEGPIISVKVEVMECEC